MQWELNNDRPVYQQLIEQVQARIISGYYKPGDKLPSVRDLAAEATVNPNTMQKSLSELERIGLVYSNRTSGRYITSDESLIKTLKANAARTQILEFLDKMKSMGFAAEETLLLMNDVMKDMKNN